MRIFSQLFLLCLFLNGCSSTIYRQSQKPLLSATSFPTTLQSVRSIERKIGSKNISYKCTVGIDTSLYPNNLHFKLTKVKRFLRPGTEENMDYTVEYFATSDDSVRTILHEWNVAVKSNSSETNSSLTDTELPQENIIHAFQNKFAQLDSILMSSLGKPILKDIKGNFEEKTERDDIKWVGRNQLNVYLLMFKRDKNTYRQIRMISYLK